MSGWIILDVIIGVVAVDALYWVIGLILDRHNESGKS